MIELLEKGTKTIQCIDCGVEVEVPRMSKRTCRCSDCEKKSKKNIDKEYKKYQYYFKKFKNGEIMQYGSHYYLFGGNVFNLGDITFVESLVKKVGRNTHVATFDDNNKKTLVYCRVIDWKL